MFLCDVMDFHLEPSFMKGVCGKGSPCMMPGVDKGIGVLNCIQLCLGNLMSQVATDCCSLIIMLYYLLMMWVDRLARVV